MLDHRQGPGMPDELMIKAGLPAGAGRGLFEAPTYTCSHCQAIVVLNPLRRRERAWCRHCDHYICDGCGLSLAQTGICRPLKRVIAELIEAADRGQPRDPLVWSTKLLLP